MDLSLAKVRQNFSGYIRDLNEPIVIKNHNKPVAILMPFTEDELLYRKMKSGEIDYDTYRRKLLAIGYQDLVDRKVMVRPSDVITSEKVETEKLKTRLEASDFLLEAAKYWAGHNKWYLCGNCGHLMKPVEEDKPVAGV